MKIENYLCRYLGQIELLRQVALIDAKEVEDVALSPESNETPIGKLLPFEKKMLTLARIKMLQGDEEERTLDVALLILLIKKRISEKYPVAEDQKLVLRKGFKICVRPISFGIPVPFVVFTPLSKENGFDLSLELELKNGDPSLN